MLTALIQHADGTEYLESTREEIRWEPKGAGGTLFVGESEYQIAQGDEVFITNASGQTVRRYPIRRQRG